MTATLRLPSGKHLTLGTDVQPVLRCGIVTAGQVKVGPAGPALLAEIAACAGRQRSQHAGRQPGEIPALQPARRLYRAVGTDPTRMRPSSEALLRRVLKGQTLPALNNAVDACNLASLSFLLPIGMYDLDCLGGDVTLRLGRAGEEYPGIRKGPVHLQGRLGLFDDDGPFGSPTSDSARTAVTARTHRLLAVIMGDVEYPRPAMAENVELLGALFSRHCAGTITLGALLGWEET
jgi:DNA/RNA-binding domain of Phe-tRNA-synthetase-like protein